ncbi:MAG: ribosomal protein S18-alanine N-acetyltransferase [Rhodothermales bacterium]
MESGPVIRPAKLADLDALVALETSSFDSDILSRRNFRYMITQANASLLVAELTGAIVGYSLVLYNRGTSLARLYSVAVSPAARGHGVGALLLHHSEEAAREHDCAYMRLEVRSDNDAAIALYERTGYRQFDTIEDYYEDHETARRYEKRILDISSAPIKKTPFYEQTTDFTCGPAALMMAMRRLQPTLKLDTSLELQIWREATTIFMTTGSGGCGPHGLALAAHRRGFAVEVFLNRDQTLFVRGVRNAEKKRIIELVQRDFEKQIAQTDIKLHRKPMTLTDVQNRLDAGAVPIVMISTYRLTSNKAPHWVVVTGLDEHFVYVHDPEVDADEGKTVLDCSHIPIERRSFEGMSSYGTLGIRAAIVIART